MINTRAFADYTQVEMLVGAPSRDLRGKLVKKPELDPRDPLMLNYDKLRKHDLDKCDTADALALQDSERARMALAVPPYSI